VNGAVFKTVCGIVRAVLGEFDSHTPPPNNCGLRNSDCEFLYVVKAEFNSMNADVMKERTQKFALRIIKLVENLPNRQTATIVGKQLLRCGTSVGANYRAACRGKSRADFISKLGIVEEEADEVIYRIEILIKSDLVKQSNVENLLNEARQILAITISSINTARGGRREEREISK
jgi:four helix bundle protein